MISLLGLVGCGKKESTTSSTICSTANYTNCLYNNGQSNAVGYLPTGSNNYASIQSLQDLKAALNDKITNELSSLPAHEMVEAKFSDNGLTFIPFKTTQSFYRIYDITTAGVEWKDYQAKFWDVSSIPWVSPTQYRGDVLGSDTFDRAERIDYPIDSAIAAGNSVQLGTQTMQITVPGASNNSESSSNITVFMIRKNNTGEVFGFSLDVPVFMNPVYYEVSYRVKKLEMIRGVVQE